MLTKIWLTLALCAALLPVAFAAPAPVPDPEADPELAEILHPLYTRQTPLAQVYSKCTTAKTVALTFDDGPYSYLKDISNTLTNNGAKGTFFFNGNNWACIYSSASIDRVKYVYSKGHQVASHTWSHANLATLSWDKIHDEMWKVEQALLRIVGVSPAFMRPPYGSYNNLVRQASAVRNQSLVLWDFDSGDSTGSSAQQSNSAYDQKIAQKPNTILALNHETYSSTAYTVLPHAIQKLKAAGYKMVTVAECLGNKKPYTTITTPQTPNSSWKC